MSAFQILTRDKQGGEESAGSDIVSYRLPAAADAPGSKADDRYESLNLPQVVLRLPILAGTRRKLPSLSIAQLRTHASTIVLVLGALFALWLIFGGKRPVEHKPVDEAPAWAAPGPAKAPEPASPIVPALPAHAQPAANVETHAAPAAPPAEPAPSYENAPLENHDPSAPNLPPQGEPAPQDGTARAVPTEIRTANRPEETRWDGGNRVAPGEAAPLGIGTGVPQ